MRIGETQMPGGADDSYVDTVDEIAAALREDPVLVQDVMGNGHTAEIDAHLTQLVEQAEVPVYVVLGVTPRDLLGPEPDAELVHILHGRFGEGLYIVGTATQSGVRIEYYGPPLVSYDSGSNALSNLSHDAFRQVEASLPDQRELAGATFAALAVELVDEDIEELDDSEFDGERYVGADPLAAAQVDTYSGATWTYGEPGYGDVDEPAEPGFPVVVGVAAALTAGIVGYRVLQAVSGLRRGRRVQGFRPDLALVGAQAEGGAIALLRRLEEIPGDPSEADLDARALASQCLDAAAVLRVSSGLDLIAALVLIRTGHHALDEPGRPAYRCCFIDPLHGEGTRRVPLGGREQVPVCNACATVIAKARPLAPLLEERLGPDRPYYESGSRWAETGFGSLDPERFVRTAGGVR